MYGFGIHDLQSLLNSSIQKGKRRCLQPCVLARIGFILLLDLELKIYLFCVEDFKNDWKYSGKRLLTIL